ncbi:MAG: hypothetical protein HRT44_09700, partial [Bdellovibrionales bacterium]|nr:hypothetical protein [Bdellovibrionales bacterium]
MKSTTLLLLLCANLCSCEWLDQVFGYSDDCNDDYASPPVTEARRLKHSFSYLNSCQEAELYLEEREGLIQEEYNRQTHYWNQYDYQCADFGIAEPTLGSPEDDQPT